MLCRRWVHVSVRLQFKRGDQEDTSLALVAILQKLDEETLDEQASLNRANDEYRGMRRHLAQTSRVRPDNTHNFVCNALYISVRCCQLPLSLEAAAAKVVYRKVAAEIRIRNKCYFCIQWRWRSWQARREGKTYMVERYVLFHPVN